MELTVERVQVNVAAPLMVTRALMGSLLLCSSGSSIVFIGSSVSQRGSPGQAVYAASKAALAGAARTLAVMMIMMMITAAAATSAQE